jgi:hypothetical protein
MADTVPFALDEELYTKLQFSPENHTISRTTTFQTRAQKTYLPGAPQILLPNSDQEVRARSRQQINSHLQSELVSPELNDFSPYLWLVATQNSSHISPLTYQIVRGRNIIVTEKPDLHLTWIYDRVFLKPIPKVLLSHAFWECYLTRHDHAHKDEIPSTFEPQIRAIEAAKGYLRSYSHLIRHRSDYDIARKMGLVPRRISYAQLIKFLQRFHDIPDKDVSPRYHFGELRLGRLNFWFWIILRRWSFQKAHGDYASYFGRFYGPFLFAFSVLSVLLSAMQVLLQARTSGSSLAVTVAHGFSIFAMIIVAVVVTAFIFMFLSLVLREVVFACTDLRKKAKARRATQC